VRATVLGFALAWVLAGGAEAQDAPSLLRLGAQAYAFAEYGAAQAFLRAGLNPGAGPRDTLWVASVHRLAHILIEEGKDSVAAVWLRWALRVQARLVVDTVNFPPPVEDAFARARAFVADGTPGDTLAETTWDWVHGRGEPPSGLRIERSGVPLSGFVEGIGSLPAGATQPLAPGSYTIVVSAPDYFFRTRVTREVLPGITTVVRFRLRGPSSQALGLLYVASTPWAVLYLDGERTDYTPVAARPVAVGTHRMRLERAGYMPFDTLVTVGHDQRLRLGTIRLRVVGSQ